MFFPGGKDQPMMYVSFAMLSLGQTVLGYLEVNLMNLEIFDE